MIISLAMFAQDKSSNRLCAARRGARACSGGKPLGGRRGSGLGRRYGESTGTGRRNLSGQPEARVLCRNVDGTGSVILEDEGLLGKDLPDTGQETDRRGMMIDQGRGIRCPVAGVVSGHPHKATRARAILDLLG